MVDKKELLEIALSCCFGHCEVGIRMEEFAAKIYERGFYAGVEKVAQEIEWRINGAFYADLARKTVYNSPSETLTGETDAYRRADQPIRGD